MTSSAPMESADQTARAGGRASTTMVVLTRPPPTGAAGIDGRKFDIQFGQRKISRKGRLQLEEPFEGHSGLQPQFLNECGIVDLY